MPNRQFGGPEHVLHYLARYTHRIAISNHRLLSFDGKQVTFRWKDYAHGIKKRTMTVSAGEFLRRFLLHVLPGALTRIRYFGRSTYILGPPSTLDVCSYHLNSCNKALRKSQPVACPRPRFQSTSRRIRRWRISVSQNCVPF